ncbi:MAG TPA: CocE/NonD family hydrolase, partial [Gemmatimonadales bacterium]|nr:CocE/NonD family hydrolase [Gemmatimonadales bacterium]
MRPALILGTVLTVSVIGALAAGAASRRAPAEASPPAYDVSMQEAWIPMRDGVRLAADLYLPKGGKSKERFPVLLEYLPYRKTEERGDRHGVYAYFVRRGYIVARVDIRGTGNSEGRLIEYEYTEQEQKDGEDVIAWLARQPFSTGKVGMFGISWGGFNSIHMAMRNPPALKAIIAIDATDDLYEDDVHFMDGGMHVDSWEMSMDLANAMPGAPGYVIDEAFFRDRFDTPPWMLTYKRQQRDGPFWDRTALKTRYGSIKIPTFMIGGWYDGYRDSVPRVLEHLTAPVKAIVGPWSHFFPHDAQPQPRIEWRHEAVRWFDQHLKGRDTGIMAEPRFAVFVRRWHPPGSDLDVIPGEWRWEDGWPIARIQSRTLYPEPNHTLGAASPAGTADTDGGMTRPASSAAPAATVHSLRYVPTSGIEAGGPVMWWGDMAPDQRPTDALALVYDSDPLEEEVEILGLPHAVLNVSADAPLARWFPRLSDVAPDGTVTLITGAGFNGAHRESARNPKPLEPGRPVTLDIEMHFTSWVFPKGHRMRLAVGNSQWPMIWPTPYPMTTTLHLGGPDPTRLLLPVVPRADRPAPKFLQPEADPKLPGFSVIDEGTTSGYGEISSIERSPQRHATKVVATNGGGAKYPWGTERYTESITHEARDDHPEATSVLGEYSTTVQLPDRTLRWEARLTFRSDRENFYYTY